MAYTQSFGTEWWTRQWIGALEAFGWENRLQRGRTYARTGRVVSLSVEAGLAEASVRGSQPAPYRVLIRLQAFPRSLWDSVLDLIARKARYTGQLLAGEMPPDVDELFAATGHSLFPQSQSELTASCSCPDDANPCKHIAAVLYVLGSRFDADPCVLFRLRGMPREVLLAEIRARRHVPETPGLTAQPNDATEPPRPIALAGFHGNFDDLTSQALEIDAPEIDPAAFALSLPRALTGDARLLEALAQMAKRASLATADMA
ncbi:MAG: SWIM zinc finger family protein [Chloroflexota bacterium]